MENICSCPKQEDCIGCKNPNSPCLRLEYLRSQEESFQVCQLKARSKLTHKKKKSKKGKSSKAPAIRHNLDLFDAGAAHNGENFKGLKNILNSSGEQKKCLDIVPFYKDNRKQLPPAFVQASVLTNNDLGVGQVILSGSSDLLPGLQIFVDNHWVTYVTGTDLPNEKRYIDVRKMKKRKKEIIKVEKEIYERVSIEWSDLVANDTSFFQHELKGKTAVVHVKGVLEKLLWDYYV